MGCVGVNWKWSGISLGGHVGCVRVNRKWSGISLGVMWGVWKSTGSGLGLVWGSFGCVGVNRKWSGISLGSFGVCGSQPEVVWD